MTVQKGLGAGDVLRELVARDEDHHAVDPGLQVTIVAEETLEVVRIHQLVASAICLWMTKQR